VAVAEIQDLVSPRIRRSVRVLDVDIRDTSTVANGIEDMYDDGLDVVVVRNALDGAMLARVGEKLDSGALAVTWSRPNETMPVEDLQLLGTDTPATPTFRAPRGASLDAPGAFGILGGSPAMREVRASSRVMTEISWGRTSEAVRISIA